MLSYFLIYSIPFFVALSMPDRLLSMDSDQKYVIPNQRNNLGWFMFAVLLVWFIGYRHEIGGDWFTYLRHFNLMSYYTFEEILKRADPGYYLVNWLMLDWKYQIYAVNIICGSIFMTGLIIFAKRQPNPWLAVAVAFPYLVVVVAMGYTRQGVALGFVFWGLAALDEKKFKQFLVLVALASTFHKSAVLMVGLGAFLQGKGKAVRFVAVAFVAYGVWSAFLAQHQEQLWDTYVSQQMRSQGAIIRVAMNLIPALIFLFYRKQWQQKFNDYTFWRMIALGAVASAFLVSFASTAVDRIALYFTPIQVVVYARLPYLLSKKFNPMIITLGILLFYMAVLFVWLNFAIHSRSWVPYNNLWFADVI